MCLVVNFTGMGLVDLRGTGSNQEKKLKKSFRLWDSNPRQTQPWGDWKADALPYDRTIRDKKFKLKKHLAYTTF